MPHQCCTIHIWEKDGQVHLFCNFDPPIADPHDSAHVPNNVEAVVTRMLHAANESPAPPFTGNPTGNTEA